VREESEILYPVDGGFKTVRVKGLKFETLKTEVFISKIAYLCVYEPHAVSLSVSLDRVASPVYGTFPGAYMLVPIAAIKESFLVVAPLNT